MNGNFLCALILSLLKPHWVLFINLNISEIMVYLCVYRGTNVHMHKILLKIHRVVLRYTWPYGLIVALVFLSAGLYYAFFSSPIDYQQKESVRIMYIHVPSSWLAVLIYTYMGISSFISLVCKSNMGYLYIRSSATPGLCFSLISLITGAIWGKVTWGAWWVWDARLTSMLILCFLYLGYMLLVNSFAEQETAQRNGAFLLVIGLINVPIIKFSVDWWSTLHQGASIIRSGGSTINVEMMMPLILCFIGFVILAYTMVILCVEKLILQKKLQRLILLQARKGV